MNDDFNANEFAKFSAVMAFDQQREWGSLENSIDNYFDNLRSTLVEYGVNGQWEVADAEEAFWRKAAELGYVRP